MYTARDIAEFFIWESLQKRDSLATNLWIQKMLYYGQGYSLGEFSSPLFEEAIVAWNLGPVVVEVYNDFKQYGNGVVPLDDSFKPDAIHLDDRQLLNKVYGLYGHIPAPQLVEMTHSEPPWKATKINKEISVKILQDYFARVIRQ